jgi:uncharacterized repeat protein (TIGR01451 family)
MKDRTCPRTPLAGLPLAAGAGLILALAATPAQAEGVLAGTAIANTAEATYSVGGRTVTTPSNTVTITVDEILDVTVSSLEAGNVALTPGGAVLDFLITNIGNGSEAFELTVDPALAGEDFDPVVTALAYDSDGNRIYEDGVDTLIVPGGATPALAADGTLRVFVILAFPNPNPADGNLADVRLTATAATGSGTPGTVFAGQGVNGSDAVVGITTAQDNAIARLIAQLGTVTLTKSASVADPFSGTQPVPGAIVTYTLEARVTGSAAVDGLVIADPIPAGTLYQPRSLTLDNVPLTDATDGDAGEANADAIAVDLGTVPGGTTHTITFQVKIQD